MMVACSAMALLKEEANNDTQSPKSSWEKWKKGGIIGAAAITGGTLMAITGGMLPSLHAPMRHIFFNCFIDRRVYV